MLFHILMVGVGGFFGAIARFSISQILNKSSFRIPMGTLTINLLGAFLLGIIIGVKADTVIALLFGTGFMGAFTTFSTLKLEVIQLYLNKYKKEFLFYTVITYGGGLITAYFGYIIGALFV
ncbi:MULTISPECIES: fluoride efflux transporter CrcB [Peribacillus]|uniref:fluoride efflux transporter CrcB n=1 Tax=Peribacillus TaxID=2675229 RepID=UPI000BA7BE9D|nr:MULTISPECIES: fluoride efflux transporter CrcB [Peribacillus]MBD8591680.1 fluoride efflux transporter CrcB [Peribacillus simplex]MCM3169619.1 fluoride efflux transporter CrcB [Peribacillus frigoritolerans]MEE3955759.1 fluoride efflux transporter CrcB [Peribacillus frigoritolerans]PAL04632.1 chromosome condensation protein CrcB [Peribacillus simplex]